MSLQLRLPVELIFTDHNNMLKNLLLLSGFSTFAVVIIIALTVWHNYQLSSISQTTQAHVVPIPASFDKKTLNDLKKRKTIDVVIGGKSEIVSSDSQDASTITVTITPSPTIQTTLIASVSATPTATPQIVPTEQQ